MTTPTPIPALTDSAAGAITDTAPSTGTEPGPVAHVPSPAEPLAHQLLAALALHRIATTHQLRALLRPHATRQTVSAPLNRLRRHGLVDYTVLRAVAKSDGLGSSLVRPGRGGPAGDGRAGRTS
ncbi:replication-relaxation family protein, partial [Streptomyces sp. NPDC047461]|uniref:replication-relaxation family protein n=1 Tax=Streptomyces sp. NPDC047461 TaxID=3155619 RepID=UPI0033C6A591